MKGRQPIRQQGRPQAVFSYYAGDTPRKQDNVRSRQVSEERSILFQRLRLLPTLTAVAAILISIVYSTTLSTNPGIVFVGESSPYRSKADYSSGAEKLLKASTFNRSKLTLDTKKTELELLKLFPELDVATVSLPVIGRRPTLTLHARQPSLLLTTANNAYILDTSGKAVAVAAQLLSSAKEPLLAVQDQSGLAVKPGSQVLTAESVKFILNIRAQLFAKQLLIQVATFPAVPNEVDFRIKDLPYYIKTDTTGDPRLQAGAFLATKDSGVAPGEYMDVRVEEKVFYK